MAKRKALFTVDLGNNGGRKIFYSIEKIKEWIDYEHQYWNWISPYNREHNVLKYYNHHFQHINQIRQLVHLLNQQEGEVEENKINEVQSLIVNAYKNNNIIHSKSIKALYLEKLRKKNERYAAYTFSYFYGNRQNHIDFILAAFDGLLFEKGYRDLNLRTNKELAHELIEDLKESKSEAEGLLEQSVLESTDIVERLEIILEKYKEDFSTQLKSQNDEFGKLVQTTSESLSNIEAVYDKKLAVQSSVRYWKAKAKSHKDFLDKFYWIFGSIISVSALIIFLQIKYLFKGYGVDTPPPYWLAAIVILTMAVAIWLVRVLAKIMLSNIHLRTDADERRVMILTYLSLLRRENAITEEDRKVILQTLFRPSATGIIKDDNLPTFLWDKFTST
ncbi:MAG: hypothetical protein CL671_14995 [Balneola sp.]|jgi:hypothetical protein|nr:hypothetical protein [Balneola sp.]MAO77099.1 hypothetical protein [Balneola sp.]MBF64666.1 hypothetical protein [Balneola sp.]MBF65918.1 hypothetical protein [Balneola sp.]|tara:strand:+ start:14993 stop:16159 length:1167 start_codon:yes stop_codon:yes gene_type:complete